MNEKQLAALEALQKQEEAQNAPIKKLEVGETLAGIVVSLKTDIPTEYGEANILTLETLEGYQAIGVNAVDLKRQLIEGEYVSEWADNGQPEEFVTLGTVAQGELVSIRRSADKKTGNGFYVQRYVVRRAGAPGSFDIDYVEDEEDRYSPEEAMV